MTRRGVVTRALRLDHVVCPSCRMDNLVRRRTTCWACGFDWSEEAALARFYALVADLGERLSRAVQGMVESIQRALEALRPAFEIIAEQRRRRLTPEAQAWIDRIQAKAADPATWRPEAPDG